jgi:hypothetical protein
VILAEQAARVALGNAFLRQIGVDGGGAHADQHREIMRVDAFGRAHIDGRVGSQALAHEMAVHCARGQNHRHCRQIAADALVGQDQVVVALANRVFGFGRTRSIALRNAPS